jgi:hypothetical protein
LRDVDDSHGPLVTDAADPLVHPKASKLCLEDFVKSHAALTGRPSSETQVERERLRMSIPSIEAIVSDVDVRLPSKGADIATYVEAARKAIDIYATWIEKTVKPQGGIGQVEFPNSVVLEKEQPQSPPRPDLTQKKVDRVDIFRFVVGVIAFLASAGFALSTLVWTWKTLDAIQTGVLELQEFTLGVGLVLIGKGLMTLLLLGAAYAAFKAGERTVQPTQVYVELQRISAKGGDVESLEGRVLQMLKTLKELAGSGKS